jgi:hypothetical protein
MKYSRVFFGELVQEAVIVVYLLVKPMGQSGPQAQLAILAAKFIDPFSRITAFYFNCANSYRFQQ